MGNKKEWFGEWFDSPYYHILYKHRNLEEAKLFIDNLVNYFHFKYDDKIIDLGCGKGRHSIYLHRLGFQVVGLDLSKQNIAFAQRFSNIFGNERLKFHVQDMRKQFAGRDFDYVLNMFTSFGYFETDQENMDAIVSAADSLKLGGKLVIDFFNTEKVISQLVPHHEVTISGINFRIHKSFENGFIVKQIRFEDKGNSYHFTEKVRAIKEADFLEYFRKAGLKLIDCFGNYKLEKLDKTNSERMIFIVEK